MEFNKVMRFDEPFWFSGIYKITRYTWYNGGACEPYYHAYYIPNGGKNWGNYVGGRIMQYNKKFTLSEAKQMCAEHAKEYTPMSRHIKQATIAQEKWIKSC